MNGEPRQRLDSAAELLRAGRTGQATGALLALIADHPDYAEPHELLAKAKAAAGDHPGSETSLRAALALDPRLPGAATRLADMLIARRAVAEAAALLKPFVGTPLADANLLNSYGIALRSLRRMEEGVDAHRAAADLAPAEGAYAHNLAGAFGDAQRFAESESACRRAFSTGLDAPETWLILGRALIGQGRLDEAEAALRQSIQRRPGFADAHAELAQLIWTRTEDLAAARADLDAALRGLPLDGPLNLARARLLEYGDSPEVAYASLGPALEARPGDLILHVAAALLAAAHDPAMAMFHALRAQAIDPNNSQAAAALCQANLAAGRADVAAVIAEKLCDEWPRDQHPVTLAATAWRMLGEPRYRDLYDYERLVRAYDLETPSRWETRDAYLADLALSLKNIQNSRTHPVGQSLRHGAQTGQSLIHSDDPVLKAFFAAIDRPIRDYIEVLAARDDILGRRATDGYRLSGAWSVLLRPGGHHVNHIHPMGWISSAFHIELPSAVDHGHEGWLKFGEPGLPTQPTLAAEHWVKPKAGTLVLFPSYMWHGTVPFGGEEPRLTIAFDVIPA